jgi:peptidoglycan/xylan/chitin deacetylase (PgdA/CDA1 family)
MAVRPGRLTLFALAASVLSLSLATSTVAAATGLPTVVRHVPTDKKVIALTFDDGWSPTNAMKIVAILDQYGATATFFPYAKAAAGAPSVWKSIAQRFPIGDHTTTHPHLPKLSASQIFWEIDNARQVIESMTGVPMVRIFRPPYMDYNLTVEQQAFKAGFGVMALWSIDTQDSLGADANTIYTRAIQGQPGGIVIMHAGPGPTVDALPQILQYYQSHGFSFVTIPKLIGMPWSPPDGSSVSGSGGPDGDENQALWTGPVYVRSAPIARAVPE